MSGVSGTNAGPGRPRFFLLSTLGNPANRDLVFFSSPPEGLGQHASFPAIGERVAGGARLPLRARLEEPHPGIKLSSLLGNTNSHLIVAGAFRRLIELHVAPDRIEYLPLVILDHRGRLHSDDFTLVNPIGALDCLDYGASDIVLASPGEVLAVKRPVLSARKVRSAPALFRVDQAPTEYVVSVPLARAMKEAALTNVFLDEIPVSAS